MNISYKKLRTKKRDSLVISLWDCGHPFDWKNDTVDFWSYHTGNLEYVTNKEDAILLSGKFKNNTLIQKERGISLTENTTLEEFGKIFPNPLNYFLEEKKLNPKSFENMDYLYVGFTSNQPEDHWVFYFKNGKLYSFELYWWLC